MSVSIAFRVGFLIVVVGVGVMSAAVVGTRALRRVRRRRHEALVAEVRPLVLSAIDGDGAVEFLTARRTRVAESIAVSLLPKLRGADRDALSRMLEANGVLDTAIAGLGSRSAARRHRSVALLGAAGFVPAERQVAACLRDRDAEVRIAAARALGRIGESRSVRDLFVALGERRIPANTASMAVLRIGPTSAADIEWAVRSDEPVVRSVAVELAGALGMFGTRRLIEALLHDDRLEVRTGAARALGRLSMPSSTNALHERLGRLLRDGRVSADEAFAVAIAETLGRIGSPASIPMLEACLRSRYRLSHAATSSLSAMGVGYTFGSGAPQELCPPSPSSVRFDLPAPERLACAS